MNKKSIYLILTLFILIFISGCKKGLLNPKEPVTLTMWHNFGGDMQQTMDKQINEFNNTIGKEKGIIVNVTATSSTSELQANLEMIAKEEPGAPELPDIMTCYPRTAILFQTQDKLVDFHDYFTKKELENYVPQFIEEGIFDNDGLYVFPIAKSTEILYVNQTFFDRFSSETGVTMECFDTIEGIQKASDIYYQWTDSKTPDTPGDGKTFFCADSWLNLTQAAMLQLDSQLFKNEALNLHSQEFENIFNILYTGAAKGGFAIYDGYSSDLAKSGELICSTGSSAGILFYGDTVTYADNTTEKVDYTILPFPVMKDGKKIAIQRGNGMCITKSTPQKEYAASIFLKWFTSPEQNTDFVSSTGYLPVNKASFNNYIDINKDTSDTKYLNDFLSIAYEMYHQYDFFVAPTFEDYSDISSQYEASLKEMLYNSKLQYENLPKEEKDDILGFCKKGIYQFIDNLTVGGN